MSQDRCTKEARRRTQYEEVTLSDEVCHLDDGAKEGYNEQFT